MGSNQHAKQERDSDINNQIDIQNRIKVKEYKRFQLIFKTFIIFQSVFLSFFCMLYIFSYIPTTKMIVMKILP